MGDTTPQLRQVLGYKTVPRSIWTEAPHTRLVVRLRGLADTGTAAVAPAAIGVVAATLAELLATERSRAKIRDLRAELRVVAASLTPTRLVTGLTELLAPIPAAAATASIVPVPVRCLGVVVAQANGTEESQH